VPTTDDMSKLLQVLGYLKNTKNQTLHLIVAGKTTKVVAYVDAACALHSDSKSHTGVVIYVGDAMVYISLKKQECMSKSALEAEMIALMDNLGLIELFQEFVKFVMKKKARIPVVYQDCNAVVMLIMKGGGKLHTKHLRARMHLGKEMVDEKRVKVIYKNAEGMLADGFSKVYDPVRHVPFAKMILGETKAGQQVGTGNND
jgi:hypothetical protein